MGDPFSGGSMFRSINTGGFGGAGKSTSTSTIIQNGKKITVTKVTTTGSDGKKTTEIKETVTNAAGPSERHYLEDDKGQKTEVKKIRA